MTQLPGGDGNDILIYNSADQKIDGGDGTDVLRSDEAALGLLNNVGVETDAATGFSVVEVVPFKQNIKNIEVLLITDDAESSPTKGGLLNLTAQDVLEMTGEKHQLTILGNHGDVVNLGTEVSAWNNGGGAIDADGFQTFTQTFAGVDLILKVGHDVVVGQDSMNGGAGAVATNINESGNTDLTAGAPLLTVLNQAVDAGQTLHMSDLISARDPDGDALSFSLYDSTPGGGHFEVNGVEQPADQIVSVTAAQLAQTTFVSHVGDSDDLAVRASDGSLSSAWGHIHVEVASEHAPVVVVPNQTVDAAPGQILQMSDLISATDQDGDALNYFLFDGTVGGGHLAVDGVEQAAGQLVNLTAAQLAETTFVPAVNGSDDLVVFATDGERFSNWAQLHIEGPSNTAASAWADLHIV